MRIVVTGATGNVGTAVLRQLQGNHEITAVARRLPEMSRPTGGRSTTWVSIDLTADDCAPLLAEVCTGADAVVHLAWGFQPSHDPDYLEALGVGGTARVIDAVRVCGVPHLVHVSSVGAYAPRRDEVPVDEGWPTDGVPASPYSRHKVAAERLLDAYEREPDSSLVTRLRPGIVGQRSAGSALLRYGVPGWLPSAVLGHLPVLPLDRRLAVSVVHADDLAEGVSAVLRRRVGGAFNLAAETPLTAELVAEAFDARLVHVPSFVLRFAVSASWHARLQQLDPGWIDLAFTLPLLDSSRARVELGWRPSHDAREVLAEIVDGMRRRADGATPVLRPRSVLGAVRDAARHGPVGRRRRP